MTSFSPSTLGRGFNMAEWECSLVNRTGTALAAGDVITLDLAAASEALAANLGDGTDLDPLANAVDIAVSGAQTGLGSLAIVAVADEVIADNDAGKFWFRHPMININVPTVVAGTPLFIGCDTPVADNRELDLIATVEAVLASGGLTRMVAIALEADTAGLARCLFDGVQGLGVYSATT